MAAKTPKIKHRGAELDARGIAALIGEATGWRPEIGDEVEGQMLGIRVGTSSFGGTYPILFVIDKESDEPVSLHAFHEVLRNEIVKQRPKPGETVYVKFLGEKPEWEGPKGYNAPMLYAFAVLSRDTSEDVYAQLGMTPDADASEEKPSQFADAPPFE
jgi:hypothetical protein